MFLRIASEVDISNDDNIRTKTDVIVAMSKIFADAVKAGIFEDNDSIKLTASFSDKLDANFAADDHVKNVEETQASIREALDGMRGAMERFFGKDFVDALMDGK